MSGVAARPSPFRVTARGVRVAVRVNPRAARSRIEGIAAEADGGAVVRVAVTAPPADGKANAAVLDVLAEAWRVKPSALALAAGATGRRKTIEVAGDPAMILARLETWRDGLDG